MKNKKMSSEDSFSSRESMTSSTSSSSRARAYNRCLDRDTTSPDQRKSSLILALDSPDSECSRSDDDSFLGPGGDEICSEDLKDLGGGLGGGEVCCGCKKPIRERHMLKVRGFHRPWHTRCLRCCVCNARLDSETSCFYRGNSIYCKHDYLGHRFCAVKCSKCDRALGPTDWVRRARDHLYHLACFACDACKRQLSTGEEFALHEDRLLCKIHFVETATGTSENDGEDGGSGHKQKTKRVRTSFTEDQLRVLHANFRIDSNPDGQDLERIAQQTGLSKRVTQVWFQNSRARQKKHQQTTTTSVKINNSSTAAAVTAVAVAAAAHIMKNNNSSGDSCANNMVGGNLNMLMSQEEQDLVGSGLHKLQHSYYHVVNNNNNNANLRSQSPLTLSSPGLCASEHLGISLSRTGLGLLLSHSDYSAYLSLGADDLHGPRMKLEKHGDPEYDQDYEHLRLPSSHSPESCMDGYYATDTELSE